MRSGLTRYLLLILCLGSFFSPLFTGFAAQAQQAVAAGPGSPDSARIAALEKQLADQSTAITKAQTAGDNAWMLVSAALVLMMRGPGLALFYGGLVRRKNVLGTMMQTFAMMAVVTILWALLTYSLAFGSGNAISAPNPLTCRSAIAVIGTIISPAPLPNPLLVTPMRKIARPIIACKSEPGWLAM